jgi:hypothetical protein
MPSLEEPALHPPRVFIAPIPRAYPGPGKHAIFRHKRSDIKRGGDDPPSVGEEPLPVDQHARIRDVRIGLEGAVYVLSGEGKLFKLMPK